MAKLNELVGIVNEITAQVIKSKDEVVAKIAELEAALVNVELPAEATAALNALKTSVQEIDNLNPDAVTETTTTTTAAPPA